MRPPPRVFAIIPAYCEQELIAKTILEVPPSVHGIIVVDDGSTDSTVSQVLNLNDPRTKLVQHGLNRGVGAAIYSGYQAALESGADSLVVMAGDNQMDGGDLDALLALAYAGVDYVKGNRHRHALAAQMPRIRRWGSSALALLTSLACGIRLGDSQCGYTVLSRRAAMALDFTDLWSGYGYPNDLLITLARKGFQIEEVPVRPVYRNERSGLRPWHFFLIIGIILRRWFRFVWSGSTQRTVSSSEQLIG